MLGVDARKVAATRLSPPVHTGIAHRQPGIGQIGGGVTHPPLEAFDAGRRGARLTRAEQVHRELRAALLRGEFPYGQRLVEEQLAERFATSRTPVREALRRLEGDGHVVRDRSGGLRPEPAAGVGHARALRRARRARGPRRAHRGPGRGSTG